MQIPFNKPYLTGMETHYIVDSVEKGKISGNGYYTKLCQEFFKNRYGFLHCLMTTSCTDALEMAAILLDIKPGDEVIMPSYTFVSTANAFLLRGAHIVFADSESTHPNMDASLLEGLINPRTKAIVVVHYAGMACDMGAIKALTDRHGIFLVEDAAQAIESFYVDGHLGKKVPLGSIGHLATFSFHETKNIIAGEGGLLAINDPQFSKRAEIIWEKGTNRAAFFRGEVDKYNWVDIGSSFLPSELTSSFLWAQLQNIDSIQRRRMEIWQAYDTQLAKWTDRNGIERPQVPSYSKHNGHIYYLLMPSIEKRDAFIAALKAKGIHCVFHYISLHSSSFFQDRHDGRDLPNSDHFTKTLVRLPLFYELNEQWVINTINELEL